MDIKRNRENGRYMATISGTLNGVPYTFSHNLVAYLKQCIVFYNHLLSLKASKTI